jgi:hypothetical protein
VTDLVAGGGDGDGFRDLKAGIVLKGNVAVKVEDLLRFEALGSLRPLRLLCAAGECACDEQSAGEERADWSEHAHGGV